MSSPDTTNQCAVSVGDRWTMDGFCTLEGVGGDSYREEYCKKMSSAGEWGSPEQTSTGGCHYNDCNNVSEMNKCEKACCPIIGAKLSCKREKFTGNPLICCLNDLTCNGSADDNSSACYSDSNKQHACADGKKGQKNYRDVTSSECKIEVLPYCSGQDVNDNSWLTRWTNPGNNCYYALIRNIFSNINCFSFPPSTPLGICNTGLLPGEYNYSGLIWAQSLMNQAFEKYLSLGYELGANYLSSQYNPWQDFIYQNVCCPYPAVCSNFLSKYCKKFSINDIISNPNLSNWCGCYLDEKNYENYIKKFNISPICSPVCNNPSSIQKTGINGNNISCEQNICVIDNNSLNLINTKIQGPILFSQICGNCTPGSCSCVVENNEINVEDSTIGGIFVPFNNNCGSINCLNPNTENIGPSNVLYSNCSQTNPLSDFVQYIETKEQENNNINNFWTLVIIFALIFLIILFLIFFYPSFIPRKSKDYSRKEKEKSSSSLTEKTKSGKIIPEKEISPELFKEKYKGQKLIPIKESEKGHLSSFRSII